MARKYAGLPLGTMIALCAILLWAPVTDGQMTIRQKTYVVTGTVGLAGVTMQGFPGTPAPTTDDNGVYSVQVIHGWTGTVTPVKKGYTFTPKTKTYPKVTENLSDQNYTATLVTYTISGSVGQSGVKMTGFPDEVISDASGRYSATVPADWNGKVVPEKTAWQFDPSNKAYTAVARNLSEQDYKASEQQIVISGTAVDGAVLNVVPGTPVTADPKGAYRIVVKYNWSGKVTPVKDGYEFSPPEHDYAALTENQTNQDYTAKMFTYQISGSAGLAGVVMKGLPGEPMTDNNGLYTATVPHGWTGAATPDKPGYNFTPKSIPFTKVTASKDNQDFVGKVLSFTISGTTGTPGVTLSGLPGDPVSNDKGQYTAQVEYGFNELVTPRKDGFLFTPPSKQYTPVAQNQTQNYTAQPITYKISGNVNGQAQVVLKGFPGPATVATGPDGAYSVNVPHNWKGTVTPQKAGFTFDPNSRAYSEVVTPLTGQDYTSQIMQCTLSGRVTDETGNGVADAFIVGDAGSATSDATGKFELKVNYGWKGKLTFQKDGYTLNPSYRMMETVGTDVKNIAIGAKAKMMTITDRVSAGDGPAAVPIANVKITANPGNATAETDLKGVFSIKVPYGWTGELKFEKEGFEFSPDTKQFANVTEDIDTINPKKTVASAPQTATPAGTSTPASTAQTPTPAPTPSTTPTAPTPATTAGANAQAIQQQIAQLRRTESTLMAQAAAARKKGEQVPADTLEKISQIQQDISNLLSQARPESATPPELTTRTTSAGGQAPVVGDLQAPNLLDVLEALAKQTGVTISTDMTVKGDPVTVPLTTVVGLPVPAALQKILSSVKTGYAFDTVDDRSYKVFRPISNAFPGVELVQALQDLSLAAGVSIIPDPNITGTVNVTFENVSLDEALQMLLAGKPYVYKKMPRYYLVADRSTTSRSFADISETRRVRLNYTQPTRAKQLLAPAFAAYVQAELPNARDPNDQGNTLMVTAAPALADRIVEDIKKIDLYKRQVLLDARVVVMEKGNLLNLGTEWSWPTMKAGMFTDRAGDTAGVVKGGWPYGVQIGYAPDRTFTNSLMMALNLLEENSQADIIANPKVVAQDGRQAEMRVIQEEWFMMSSPQVSDSFYSRAELQKIESGTALIITPYIGDNNDITLQMAVEVSDSIPKARGSDLPLVTRRTARNSVTVKDGGTVAVGGLTENRSKSDEKRVPILSNIPLLGEVFKNHSRDKASREVAVFVTAHLVPEGTQVESRAPAEPGPVTTTNSQAESPDAFRQKLAESMNKSQ